MSTRAFQNGLIPSARNRLSRWPAWWGRRGLNLLFPPRCANCDADLADLEDGVLLCSDCREAGHTRASVLRGYCELVTADVDGARQRLTALWRRFGRPADREVLGAWIKAHSERYAAA